MQVTNEQVARAKELIHTTRHISLATVNIDGSSHNSPVRFLYDNKLENIYWGSHKDSQHSKNIARTGQVFGVLFDRNEKGGVYLKCEEGHVLSGDELLVGLEIINSAREKEKKGKIGKEYFEGSAHQQLWSAKIVNIWINSPVRDENGLIVNDLRVEVDKQNLIE
jgi:hypothetical protein